MVENRERSITALELADLMKDFGDKIDDYDFTAFIYALLQKEFFPLLSANMPSDWKEFRRLAATMVTTLTTVRLVDFAIHISDKLGFDNACKVAAIVDTLVFDGIDALVNDDSSHNINNKEVN